MREMSLTYDQFKWDEPLGDELFSLKVPQGYLLEQLTPAVVTPGPSSLARDMSTFGRLQPDGKNPEVQFVPQIENSPRVYCSDRAELSPDGRYLAVAYTNVTEKGALPSDRVLLFDRTRPKEPAPEVYIRKEGELQFWRFSADGRRLYVSWWEQLPGKQGEGHYGTDVVDIKAGTKQSLNLPTYTGVDGMKMSMRFAAAAADGQTFLVIGDGLHVATADGKLVRRLGPAHANIIVASVRVSPDGKQAVYATFHKDQRSQRCLFVPLAGGNPKELKVPLQSFTDLRTLVAGRQANRLYLPAIRVRASHHATMRETYLQIG